MKPHIPAAGSRWTPRPAPGWPDRLILFDGVCVLCSSWVRFVIRRDEACRFRFVPIQSSRGRQLADMLGITPDDPETNAVILDGMAYFKSDSVLMAARHLRGLQGAGILMALPRGLRDWLYDRVARNRYAWFGRDEACLLPTPELAARLLDQPEGAGLR